MPESKIELTSRLRREGRWEEASHWRDQEKNRLLNEQGLTRKEANPQAWKALAEKYPPLEPQGPEQPGAGDTPMPPELVAAAHSSPARFASDVLWVYENLGAGEEAAKQAPSAGAWHMLQWARTNKARFFEQTLPKAQQYFDKLQDAADQQSEVIEEDLRTVEELLAELEDPRSRYLEEHSAEIRGILEALAEGEPIGEAIRREARLMLTGIGELERKEQSFRARSSTHLGATA